MPNPAGSGRYLAISPRGDRVAFGNAAGLRVIAREGSVRVWSADPVLGRPAWSPRGTTLAYVTGPADELVGQLRLAGAGAPPRTAAPAVVSFLAVGFAADRTGPALMATAPVADPTDPAGYRVIEVALPPGA